MGNVEWLCLTNAESGGDVIVRVDKIVKIYQSRVTPTGDLYTCIEVVDEGTVPTSHILRVTSDIENLRSVLRGLGGMVDLREKNAS